MKFTDENDYNEKHAVDAISLSRMLCVGKILESIHVVCSTVFS